jgi:hypothetical protein
MVLGGERLLACLERSQDLVAELNGIAKGFQARGVWCIFVMSKVAVASTGRENQVVVRLCDPSAGIISNILRLSIDIFGYITTRIT